MTETITLKTWTARNGQTRRYINCAADLLGLEVEKYKTGNIRHAYLDGERISNAAAGRILSAKFWLDEADELHIDYWTADKTLTKADAAARITAALAAAELHTI